MYLTLKKNENWEGSDYLLTFPKMGQVRKKKLCLPDHKIDEIFHFSGAMPLLMPYFCQRMNQSDFELSKNINFFKKSDFVRYFYAFVDILFKPKSIDY